MPIISSFLLEYVVSLVKYVQTMRPRCSFRESVVAPAPIQLLQLAVGRRFSGMSRLHDCSFVDGFGRCVNQVLEWKARCILNMLLSLDRTSLKKHRYHKQTATTMGVDLSQYIDSLCYLYIYIYIYI